MGHGILQLLCRDGADRSRDKGNAVRKSQLARAKEMSRCWDMLRHWIFFTDLRNKF